MPAMRRGRRNSRWNFGVSPPAVPRAPTRWRSRDLRGPLPRRTVRALVEAIHILPTRRPWPDADDMETWWSDVLADRRLWPSSAKTLNAGGDDARLRLDGCPTKSLTFICEHCGERATHSVADLMRAFGQDRNVRTIGRELLKCRTPGFQRDGACPIKYQA